MVLAPKEKRWQGEADAYQKNSNKVPNESLHLESFGFSGHPYRASCRCQNQIPTKTGDNPSRKGSSKEFSPCRIASVNEVVCKTNNRHRKSQDGKSGINVFHKQCCSVGLHQ
jgi:hypothetical protein